MTLTELLADIQEKYAHALSNDSVIRKIDGIQKRIYRLLKKVVTTQVTVAPGQTWLEPKYRPTDAVIRPGDIRDFLVNGTSYRYQDLDELARPQYYFYVDGKYGVMPNLNTYDVVTIFHYYTPATLTSTSTAVEIDEDFQNILVYGACKEIAETMQDFDAANGYAIQFNGFLDELIIQTKPPIPQTIKEDWWG